jgi:hypothetical protein
LSSVFTTVGVMATRFSPWNVSLGTPAVNNTEQDGSSFVQVIRASESLLTLCCSLTENQVLVCDRCVLSNVVDYVQGTPGHWSRCRTPAGNGQACCSPARKGASSRPAGRRVVGQISVVSQHAGGCCRLYSSSSNHAEAPAALPRQ